MSDSIREALSFVPAHEREVWIQMGMAIKSELDDAGFDIWNVWSQQDSSYRERDAKTAWRSFKEGGGITIRSLYHQAKEHGWRRQSEAPRYFEPHRRFEWEREEARRHAAARKRAIEMMARAFYATHPYLARKGFPEEKGLVYEDRLLIPMRDMRTTQLVNSCQCIDADGTKKFLTGGKAKGSLFVLGAGPEIFLCEGYATGLSIRAALQSLYRNARVAVRLLGQKRPGLIGHGQRRAKRAAGGGKCAVDHAGQLFGRQRFEDEHAHPREERRDHLERRVLGRGAEQHDGAVLHVWQEGVLLRLVEAMDLVDEEDRAAAALPDHPGLLDHAPDVLHAGADGGERPELEAGAAGDDPGEGRLAAAGRPPEDHRGNAVLLDHPAEGLAGAEEVLLSEELLEGARAHPVGERRRLARAAAVRQEEILLHA